MISGLEKCEQFVAKMSDGNICVTKAMAEDMKRRWNARCGRLFLSQVLGCMVHVASTKRVRLPLPKYHASSNFVGFVGMSAPKSLI